MNARRGRARPSVLISPALLARWPLPMPDGETGKDGRGSVLVVGGSEQIPGAVILAGVAALRVGAGKLQIATSRAAAPLVAVTVPEARVIGLRQDHTGELHRQACSVLRQEVESCDALLVGPGMPPCAAAAATPLVRSCYAAKRGPPLVVDAGALGAFTGRRRVMRNSAAAVIATPHAGEMAALWGISRQAVMADPPSIAAQAARHLGITVVLKGACTHVAARDGRMFHNTAGNGGLGTSGSGDTLSGIIAGLCARGADPVQAAIWGVFLHAKAGDALARKMSGGRGPRGDGLGFLARELLFELPPLLTRLGRRR